MKKPKLKDLQAFVNRYFTNNPPKVKYLSMSETEGAAVLLKNIILINTKIPIRSNFGCRVGELNYTSTQKVQFKDGEQYFAVLLHEIAHFKISKKAPNYYHKVRNKAIKKIKEEFRLRSQFFGEKEKVYKNEEDFIYQNLDAVAYSAEGFIKPYKNESQECYDGRVCDFRGWLINDMPREHIAVAQWAEQEFNRIFK